MKISFFFNFYCYCINTCPSFSPFALLHATPPPLPQSAPTLLSMSISHSYLFFDYSFPLLSTIILPPPPFWPLSVCADALKKLSLSETLLVDYGLVTCSFGLLGLSGQERGERWWSVFSFLSSQSCSSFYCRKISGLEGGSRKPGRWRWLLLSSNPS